MVNILKFTTRLKKVMDFHQLSASGFADKIGVQRSSISHILSGRNKPSLDFILKINKSIKSVSLDWLLNNENDTDLQELPPISDINTLKNNDLKSEVEKIIIFFKDGTFKIYNN